MTNYSINRISVIGGGGWGTALSLILAKKGFSINTWVWDPAQAEIMRSKRENPILPGHTLPDKINITTSIPEAVKDTDLLVFVTISEAVNSIAGQLKSCLNRAVPIITATKGLNSETGFTISQTIASILGGSNPLCALSGPNLAKEVIRGIPSATVAASADESISHLAQQLFMSPTLRVYTNTDIVGVELAGALKNVIAIGAGICDGLGYGDNTKAALLTRGIAEITRLGIRIGAKQPTFMGLAGIGDLMATCASPLSRNRRVGFGLGQGKKLDEIMAEIGQGQVAEGVPTAKAAYQLAQKTNTPMPITEQVYQVLFESKSPHKAVSDLMSREPKDEIW